MSERKVPPPTEKRRLPGKLRPPGTPVRVTRTSATKIQQGSAAVLLPTRCEKTTVYTDEALEVNPSPLQGCAEDTETVRCECGATDEDGEPMLQCDECGVWSHIACAKLTAKEAQQSKFSCQVCSG